VKELKERTSNKKDLMWCSKLAMTRFTI